MSEEVRRAEDSLEADEVVIEPETLGRREDILDEGQAESSDASSAVIPTEAFYTRDVPRSDDTEHGIEEDADGDS